MDGSRAKLTRFYSGDELDVDSELSTWFVDDVVKPAQAARARPKSPTLERVKRQMEEEGFQMSQSGPNLAIPTAE